MLQDVLIPFAVVAVAELGDKTQLAILYLSSKTKSHFRLFGGAMAAFVLASAAAIALGSLAGSRVPATYMRITAGALFILFGILALAQKQEQVEKVAMKTPFLTAFLLVFATELGDKSQISAGLFAAKYNPALVFAGVMAALFMLTAAAVYIGHRVLTRLDTKVLSRVAAIIFIAVGILTLLR